MDLQLFVCCLAVLCVNSTVLSQEKCPPLVEYMYSFDFALDDHVVQSFDFYPEDWCLARCNLDQRCRSVNYNRKVSTLRNCELNSATRQQRPRSYNPRPGWVYYENKIADTLPPVVDGGWSEWGKWSSCSVNCLGEIKKTRTRTRTCSNPAPQGGGRDCSGENTDTEICARPRCFELLQTFPTRGGSAATSFEIQNELFIAIANHGDISVLFTAKLSVYVLHSNKFTLNQTLDTWSATNVEYFTMQGEHFLLVARVSRFRGIFAVKEESVLYRLESGIFKNIQRIPARLHGGIHSFTNDTRKFIIADEKISKQVSIYEWKNGKFGNKTLDIAVKRPSWCNTFTVNNTTYMACGSFVPSNATTVLKWSGNRFQAFQVLPSMFVRARPHSFKANGVLYLAIQNFRLPLVSLAGTYSSIYRWNSTKFVHYQDIATLRGWGCDSFTTANNEVFLALAETDAESAVYKMADSKFNLYQKLPTTGAVHVHAFTHKGKQYMAAVNHVYCNNYNLDSAVYIWK